MIEPKRKRRWFQFSLRSLMIGVTLMAVVCGYVEQPPTEGLPGVNPLLRLPAVRDNAAMQSILKKPPGPGFLRSCPACGKWFALKPTQTQQHPTYGNLRSFRCKFCGNETTFAQKLPPRVL